MAKTKLWAVALIIIITFIITAAQIFYKSGMNLFPELNGIILVVAGMILYVLGAVLMILAFRGGELSILYPLLALSYIWVSIASPAFFSTDSMNPLKWIGIIIIICGITSIGVGSTK